MMAATIPATIAQTSSDLPPVCEEITDLFKEHASSNATFSLKLTDIIFSAHFETEGFAELFNVETGM